MYYPYLRGRQNELFCLRELLRAERLSRDIVPIIEPVRFSKVLVDTLQDFLEAGRSIALIRNPKVGTFMKEYYESQREIQEESDEKKKNDLQEKMKHYFSVINDERIICAYINDASITDAIVSGRLKANESFILNTKKDTYDLYYDKLNQISARMTFIPKDEDFKDEVCGDVSLLENSFVKAKRNKDYIQKEDEFFSMNHLIYRKRGYQGFSDYSIVGDEYEESGFAPAAVAIHIVYFDERKQLRVHHFVSDTNDSIFDPARKFGEAMEKLVRWMSQGETAPTLGITNLVDYYEKGKFPGLGVIKRCSMMHHLELLTNYLEENR
ncbi:MAG: sce7725 family protein [Lachnospiraceae bacterium]|nr:sce7725 family protein [Lachnospiraceae bacterium]